ncbi:DUF6236 family protein [Amycolatopsis sp. NPDC051371]|uniref:DUF6236 family protein n=1 Tax=Amycolatopsis sp. NPDC051371 TaxID=3155800 RepID=UPI0034330938
MAIMLYYPLIEPPRDVMYQGLLYWDMISTIVPDLADPDRESGWVRPSMMSPDMAAVADAGLYTPLSIASHVEPSVGIGGVDLTAKLRAALADLCSEMPERELKPRPAVEDPEQEIVYSDKLPPHCVDLLLENGLARVARREPMLIVSPAVHFTLLSVLARQLAHDLTAWQRVADRAEPCLPYTDQPWAFRLAHLPATGKPERCWQVELGGLLPVPDPSVPVSEVIAFRLKYNDERVRLVRAIRNLLRRLGGGEDPDEVFAELRAELADALSDLDRASQRRRVHWMRRSVSVLVALGSAAGAKVSPDYAWLLGLIGGYAVNVATTSMPSLPGDQGVDLSYLQRIRKAVE